MAAGILGDAIDEVMRIFNSFFDHTDRAEIPAQKKKDKAEIEKHLANIKGQVVKAEHNNETQNVDLQPWLAKTTDLVNDLIEFTEDLNDLNGSERRWKWWGSKDSATAKIKEVARKLAGLAEDYKGKFGQLSGGEIQDERDSTLIELSLFYKKRCFAYFSLFPKGYEFYIPQLIKLWTAEGFLSFWDPNLKESPDQPEDRGRQLVTEFVQRNIFQHVERDEWGMISTCRLNPRKHDLATLIGRHESFMLNEYRDIVPEGTRRVFVNYNLSTIYGLDPLFSRAKKLRTFLLPAAITQLRIPYVVKMKTETFEAIISHFKGLRVLDLNNLGIKTVPPSIGALKNLRYLDISRNSMKELPSPITKLSVLQTLKLSYCYLLKELPKGMGKLKSLRHLDLKGCYELTPMPAGVEQLPSLQISW